MRTTTRRCSQRTLLPVVLAVAALASVASAQQAGVARPAAWAQPTQLAGVPNLHRIDSHLYRSAQPTPEGMRNLQRLGIKTIVNLRSHHSDREALAGTSLRLEEIGMTTWHVDEGGLVRALRMLADPGGGPILVHCQHGADRTGLVTAMYRIVIQGWSRNEAIREMRDGGYSYHSIWSNLLEYLRSFDLERVRRQVLGENPTPSSPAPSSVTQPPGQYPAKPPASS
jgi:protein tyrosine/serine phosphatase